MRTSEDERAVVGVCLNTRHGVGFVNHLVTPEDFSSASLRCLYTATLAMTDVVTLEERIAFAVAFSDVNEARIRRLISRSPVQFDASSWARRVAAAAQQRESCA